MSWITTLLLILSIFSTLYFISILVTTIAEARKVLRDKKVQQDS